MLQFLIVFCICLAPIPTPRYDPMARGFLGIRVLAGQLTLSSVEADSPAARAGLLPGDEFLEVDHVPVQNFEQVSLKIRNCRPGAILSFKMQRGEQILTFRPILMARPSSADLPSEP